VDEHLLTPPEKSISAGVSSFIRSLASRLFRHLLEHELIVAPIDF
jgi:hypothetical protein